MAWPDSATGIAVALGCGLLIGLERERRKGRGADRAAAGLRTFAATAFAGALAQALANPALVAAGALGVAALAALSYQRSRSHDPGLTTEIALFATYLVGVQSVLWPALGAACGTALAVLLAARTQLHRFATRWLSEAELHDALLLAALALVVLPLVPQTAPPWLGAIQLRRLAALVVLILLLQAAGHVALRLAGQRIGLAASGFFSGFVSSTATVATFGAKARAAPDHARACAAAGAFSGVATWVQALMVCMALSPHAAAALAAPAAAGALTTLAAAAALIAGAAGPAVPATRGAALRPKEALVVAALLAGVTALVTYAQGAFGTAGAFVGVALAALADAHAPTASLAALFAAGRLGEAALVGGVLLALAANSTSRLVVAFASGGARYGAAVAAALWAGLAAAATVAWLLNRIDTV